MGARCGKCGYGGGKCGCVWGGATLEASRGVYIGKSDGMRVLDGEEDLRNAEMLQICK